MGLFFSSLLKPTQSTRDHFTPPQKKGEMKKGKEEDRRSRQHFTSTQKRKRQEEEEEKERVLHSELEKEGNTDGQVLFTAEASAGAVPRAQTPFVCQATKLIDIKAGSCWPGIIKSLRNTNTHTAHRGQKRGRPDEAIPLEQAEARVCVLGCVCVCACVRVGALSDFTVSVKYAHTRMHTHTDTHN